MTLYEQDFVAYGDAALMAEEETGLAEETFPPQCPYTLEEVPNPAFLPGT